MTSPPPTVSVVIAAYNAERFLGETLESLRQQTFHRWEAILVDDGSTDRTLEIALAFAQNEPRLRVLRQANQGVAVARNRALAEASGDFVAFLDSDDLWLPSKIELQVQAALEQGVDFVYCAHTDFVTGQTPVSARDFDRYSGLLPSEVLLSLLPRDCLMVPSTVMLSKPLLQKLGHFDSSLRVAEDWDLWMRIAIAGYPAYGVRDQLCHHRLHEANLTRRHELYFGSLLKLYPRYAQHVCERTQLAAFRHHFRNAFTQQGDAGHFQEVADMFESYQSVDRSGYAYLVMRFLRRTLPLKLFWFISRYAVIPLAWHLERLAEQRTGFREAA